MNVLLVEDDERLGKLLLHLLTKEFSKVDWVKNGRDANDYSLFNPYDIIILDWMLPVMDGIEVCKVLRKRNFQGGILFMTAKDSVEDVITGLDSGADDYIVKPFEFGELMARLRALSRRKPKIFEEIIEKDGLKLNLTTHSVFRDENNIELSRKEYQLLEILMRNPKQIITRELLFDKIWGFENDVSDNALDALIKLVRRKIDLPGKPSLIQNVRGVGYKMRELDV
ncbi:response regulator transcription factor [Bacillus benzoevorans]|uniref:DNA-binding response OmpR family regulator n=1 Tax=Bacillus benzoevorans TaxID=1456 RepID=A0A7X0LTQ1_9BACI|nr:response regulator transcription factor [Bacillus benzoevorans]MBB6443650.1 DNA-binding response OmpR family regulator [Bacillus benzoevorans]